MEFLAWVFAGLAAGWAGYAYLGMNEERGVLIALLIGAAGGFVGGGMVAPIFAAAPALGAPASGADAMLFAVAGAVAFLVLGNHLAKRWGV